MKKLLMVVEPKNNYFESEEMFEQNAVLFDEHMLKSFTDEIVPLLNSVSKTEWVEVSDDYVSDTINKMNFNFYFKALE